MPLLIVILDSKPSLIDLEAEIANKAQAYMQRERTSEKASYTDTDDAMFRTYRNKNCKR